MAEIVEHEGDYVLTHEDSRYVLSTTSDHTSMRYTLCCEQKGETSTLLQFTKKRVIIMDEQRVHEYTVLMDFVASEGLLIVDTFLYIQFYLHPIEGIRLIIANTVSKELMVVPRDASLHSSANNDSAWWKDSCENDIPCGWGKNTNDNDCLNYEGFRVGDQDVCYGTYYHDNGNIRYVGGLVNGLFWGTGEHFDTNGNLTYSGVWIWNRKQSSCLTIKCYYDPLVICKTLTSLTFNNNAGTSEQLTCIDFTPFKSLSTLSFNDSCFPHANVVRICDLPLLTTVTIGEACFFDYHPNRVDEKAFHLENCPMLTYLHIGRLSFYCFTVCALSSRCRIGNARIDLPALKEICMGNKAVMTHCFMYADLMVRGKSDYDV